MRTTTQILAATLVVSFVAVSATAQVLEPPARPFRGLFGGGAAPDPNRTRQDLTLSGNLLGGYDDNLVPPGGGAVVADYPGGYVGLGDASLRYGVGRSSRSLVVAARGFAQTYGTLTASPYYGGDQSLHGETSLGRSTSVLVDQSLSYMPLLSLGLFGSLAGAESNPDANPANGLSASGSWNNRIDTRLNRRLSRKVSVDAGYTFTRQTFVENASFDSQSQSLNLAAEYALSRAWSMRSSYARAKSEFSETEAPIVPLLAQSAEFGAGYRRRLSRTRQLSFSASAGFMRGETTLQSTPGPVEFTAPSGSGTVRLDFGRSWRLAGDYRRAVTAPQGITPEPFITDAATISAGGFARRWLETVGTFGYSVGAAGYEQGNASVKRYDGYTGTLQARFKLSRFWSAVVSATHTEYHLNAEAGAFLGVPDAIQRNAIRVGFGWSLPLYGSYMDSSHDSGRD